MGISVALGRFVISSENPSVSILGRGEYENPGRVQKKSDIESRIFSPQNTDMVSEGVISLLTRRIRVITGWVWARCGYASKESLSRQLVEVNGIRNSEAVKKRLDAGADVNAKDQNGSTALHILCASGSVTTDRITVLLGAGADVNAKNQNGSTALHILCDSDISRDSDIDKVSMITDLVSYGADMSHINNSNFSALDYSELSNNRLVSDRLLFFGANVNVNYSLQLAVSTGNIERVNILFAEGAKIKFAINNQLCETSLLQSVVNIEMQEERIEMLKLLFDKICSADIDKAIKEKEFEKALVTAVSDGKENVINFIFEKGHVDSGLVDSGLVNSACDHNGTPLLNLAVIYERHDALLALLQVKALPDVEDKQGRTPLYHALEKGLEERGSLPIKITRKLLEAGAKVSNLPDDFQGKIATEIGSNFSLTFLISGNSGQLSEEDQVWSDVYRAVKSGRYNKS
ncbi:ankyrin repeat domain-containing protein [Endozoicomonas sp.]|uniref:ankyrin repeat domain-containing protein n=1 Tax=Endozoicomonas sp. TaxID=1892382 RepID=UPI00383A7DAB